MQVIDQMLDGDFFSYHNGEPLAIADHSLKMQTQSSKERLSTFMQSHQVQESERILE